jgi:hypothetical protein
MLRTRRACAVALLICVGGAGAVLPNYKVSTRLYTHSNDNGEDQTGAAAMHVGDPGTRGFKDPAQTLNPKVKSDCNGHCHQGTLRVPARRAAGKAE